MKMNNSLLELNEINLLLDNLSPTKKRSKKDLNPKFNNRQQDSPVSLKSSGSLSSLSKSNASLNARRPISRATSLAPKSP